MVSRACSPEGYKKRTEAQRCDSRMDPEHLLCGLPEFLKFRSDFSVGLGLAGSAGSALRFHQRSHARAAVS